MSILIKLHNISLQFPTKTCFSGFSASVFASSKIAILGDNGSGKSSLLQRIKAEAGKAGVQVASVTQIVEGFESHSGAERFNKSLSLAIAKKPDLLLLDEPTNHLDSRNRKSLIGMLNRFSGTVIIATHDMDLIRNFAEIFWHIQDGKIYENSYGYDEFLYEQSVQKGQLEQQLQHLNREKKKAHEQLMQEQKRAKKSRKMGEGNVQNRKWPTVVSNAKAQRAEETSGQKKRGITQKRENLLGELSQIRLPERINPKFNINGQIKPGKVHVNIKDGVVGYDASPVREEINLCVSSRERLVIEGCNGSGKSTLMKAILDPKYRLGGDWYVSDVENIGYLDQHYRNINPTKTVIENVQTHGLSLAETRDLLNDYLFRSNEQINQLAGDLSGGELARLSLAQISAKTPEILLLDEITNNLDIRTKNYVISVLKKFPGAIMLISHDEELISAISSSATNCSGF